MPDELHVVLKIDQVNDAIRSFRALSDQQRLMNLQSGMRYPNPTQGGGGPAASVARAQRQLLQANAAGQPSDIYDAIYANFRANHRLLQAQNQMAFIADPNKTQAFTPSQLNRAMMPAQPITGPAARLQAAQLALARAQAGGDPTQIFDAQSAFHRAQRNFQRAQNPNQGNSGFFGRVGLNLTRNGLGFILRGGMNIGNILENLGVGAALGAVALVGLAVTIREANKEVREFTNARTVSGGSTADIATLRALGVGPNAVGASADRLYDALTRDEFAIQASTKLGFGMQVPGPWGNQNHAQILRQHLEQLRIVGRLEGAEEQLRLARMLHLETMIDELRVSDSLWNSRRFTAQVSTDVEGPDVQQRFRDFNSAWGNMLDSLKLMGVSIADLVIIPITQLMQGIGFVAGGIAELIHGTFMGMVYSVHAIAEALGLEHGYQYGADLQANTNATQANTAQMAKAGIYGGGPDSMGAIPGYLKAEAYRGALNGATISYGAFGV